LLDVGGRQFLMMGNQSGNVTPNERLGGINVGGLQVNIHGNADRRNVEQVRVAVARGLSDAAKRRTAG
jgi:hypothetical protein